MRRTFRPIPASPDANRGLRSTRDVAMSLAANSKFCKESSDCGSGEATTTTSGRSSSRASGLLSFMDPMVNSASCHRLRSSAATPSSGYSTWTFGCGFPASSMDCFSSTMNDRLRSQSRIWSPLSAITAPLIGSQSSGMMSSTIHRVTPWLSASVVRAALIETASSSESGNTSSSRAGCGGVGEGGVMSSEEDEVGEEGGAQRLRTCWWFRRRLPSAFAWPTWRERRRTLLTLAAAATIVACLSCLFRCDL
mmetsp:Transcript_14545/g.38595  ORF Transcript_14545/g.38595 Transcript_14545/m.38595 type:complete len:251 (+) Transcript_14545:378-1130(+)